MDSILVHDILPPVLTFCSSFTKLQENMFKETWVQSSSHLLHGLCISFCVLLTVFFLWFVELLFQNHGVQTSQTLGSNTPRLPAVGVSYIFPAARLWSSALEFSTSHLTTGANRTASSAKSFSWIFLDENVVLKGTWGRFVLNVIRTCTPNMYPCNKEPKRLPSLRA